MKLKKISKIYAPAFLVLWQMQAIRTISSSEPFSHYTFSGFPLIWESHSCCSLYSNIYIIPTLVNIMFWGVAAYIISRILIKLLKTADNVLFASMSLWIVGTVFFAPTGITILFIKINFHWWYNRNF